MREYELIIDDALKNGLSPEIITPFNTQVLYKCLGFRCGRLGLEAYKELNNPLPITVDMMYAWPWPQMMNGEKYNILVIRDDFSEEDIVYEISDDNSTATVIFIIDALSYGKGTLMEVADFGKYLFMTNGVIMIYWDVDINDWRKVTVHDNIPMMRTICNFKGQAFGGNVVSSWHDCDETFYIWSKIGEMDFTPTLRNTEGFRRCPYGGEVMHVRRLGDNIIGYSDKGITLIMPVNSPVTTFGFVEVYDKGIINRGAQDGSLKDHLFVDKDYNLVRILSKELPKVLGYQSQMQELEGEDIIVKYDTRLDDYYIGNSTKTFLLSSKGLTEIPQHPSALWMRGKESYIIPDTVNDYEPEIITEKFNMEFSGEKTSTTIETDAINHTEPKAGVDYAYELGNVSIGEYNPINNMGIASITTASNFFRIKLKFNSILESFRISYMKLRYKMTDLRGIRGVYAPPPRGQR